MKLRVGVIYGGRSGEHEVSVVSAASIFKHLDRSRFQPVPIRIDKDGRWVLGAKEPTAISAGDVARGRTGRRAAGDRADRRDRRRHRRDLPVLHGPYGEDGTVQGLLELANVPYVGAGVLGSALGMDKAVSKTIFAAHGLPIVPYITVIAREWEKTPRDVTARVMSSLRYPVFVKPANLGSSVGISRASSDGDLATAIREAFDYDRKIVIESGVPNAREIECAVLGNDEPEASLPGEIVVTHPDGFYSYEAKYLDPSGATPRIPADLPQEIIDRVRRLSIDAFKALDLSGMARVDFFLDGARRYACYPERGQHHPRLHRDLDVPKDVGSHRRLVLRTSQSTDHTRDRTTRTEAATAHVTNVSRAFTMQNARCKRGLR